MPDDLEDFFDAHHGMVFRTAYRITGNAADAEDVLQTVFLRLLRRDRAALPVDSPESYLRRAAVNAALDIVRAGRDQRDVPLDQAPTPAVSVAGGQGSNELRSQLRQALAKLQPREAEVFALRFFEDRSNQEIARTLGISQVHVAVILHRTRRQLQKEMGSYVGDRR